MSKRTPENCSLIKRYGYVKQENGKCYGFAGTEDSDEPCEACKRCKYNTDYEPGVQILWKKV